MRAAGLSLIAFVLMCSWAFAGPILVSDPNPTAVGGWCEIAGAQWIPTPTPLEPDGAIKVDVSAAPIGRSDIQVRVCVDDPVWGPQCSDYVPFGFVRPGPPSAARGLRLVK